MLSFFNQDDDERDPFGRIRGTVYDDRPDIRGLSTISQSVGMDGKNERTDVAVAEKLLHANGVLDTNQTKGPTGYFGMRAERAIRTFQKDRGLKVGGLMLPNGPTITALQAGTAFARNSANCRWTSASCGCSPTSSRNWPRSVSSKKAERRVRRPRPSTMRSTAWVVTHITATTRPVRLS